MSTSHTPRRRWTRYRLTNCPLYLLGASYLLTSLGCGGNGSGIPDLPLRFTNPQLTLRWSGRTRTLHGPGSALSVRLRIIDAAASGGDCICEVDRKADPKPYTQYYRAYERAMTGLFHARIEFYAGPGCHGAPVGVGTTWGRLQVDGSGFDTIGITNSIRSVSVDKGQTVPLFSTQPLTFTAQDSDGSVVGVTPGSATWNVVGGNPLLSLSPDGIASGLQAGEAAVKVKVDGVSSPVSPVTVAGSGL